MSSFPEILKNLRKEYKLTQEDISQRIGLSRAAYARYETGTGEPTINNLIILADLFKVTIDFLVGREANQESDIENIIIQKNLEKNIVEATQITLDRFIKEHEEELKKLVLDEIRGSINE